MCGSHFLSVAKKTAQCQSAKEEINVLKDYLKELGLEGKPSLEKCAAIKRKRDLQKEVEGLDTSLIIEEEGRPSRTRQRAASKPSYVIEKDSSEESEEDDDDDEEEEDGEEESGEESVEEEPLPKKRSSKKSKIESDDESDEYEE